MVKREFLTSLLAWYTLFPAALLCLAPMWNQMKSRRRTLLLAVPLLMALAAATALLETRFGSGYNALTLPLLALCFFAYHKSLRVPVCKSLSAFALACVVMSFLANFANGYDAYLHPELTLNDFSIEAAAFQAWITTFAAALLYLPLRAYGTRMVDRFDLPRVWYVTLPVDAVFLAFNLLVAPRRYATLHMNNVFRFYWLSLALLLFLYCLLAVVFYQIVNVMLQSARTAERNRILELQGSQYRMVTHYLDASARARHDFRHTIHTLQELSREKKYADMDLYLLRYASSLPVNEVRSYCRNGALNALLNYYAQCAAQSDIELRLKIELPEELGVSDMDLCNVIGNIMENAVAACLDLDKGRRISLTMTEPIRNSLCIVASNTYGGTLREENGRYLSTRHDGSAIGLSSILAIAERYGGVAQFRHDETMFYSDVMLMTGAPPAESE